MMRLSSRPSLAVSVSSSDKPGAALPSRRKAFSTSSLVMFLPSTTAQVSADTGAGADVDRQAAARHAAVSAQSATVCLCLDNGNRLDLDHPIRVRQRRDLDQG